MSSQPVSYAKAPVVITEDAEEPAVPHKRTLSMLKLVAQGECDIDEGRTSSQREVFRAAQKRLSAR